MRLLLAICLSALLLSACGGGGSKPEPGDTGDPDTTEVSISARDRTFSNSEIRVPAGQHVRIAFTNHDASPHNLSFYETNAAETEIYVGQTIRGPDKTVEYEFDAPVESGTYFFRCDVHPTLMTGELVVE